MKIAVIGTGNVGIAIAADLSIKGHEVSLVKTSSTNSETFDRLVGNAYHVWLKENDNYTHTKIEYVTKDLSIIKDSEVIFVTIQSIFHDDLYKRIYQYLNSEQVLVCICSYMSSFYLSQYCESLPMIAETTGPYLEGRVELEDIPGEVVFRVGCRLTNSPLSVFHENRKEECIKKLKSLHDCFNASCSIIESALLNPNMVLHTVGAIMSIPRIEFSDGNFCMYREAYTHKNKATLNIMLKLDEEKKCILKALGARPVGIMEAGGFLKGWDSFFEYSESGDRAISPTSVRSRYITEDVSQGLILLESIANRIGVCHPITTSLIDIASAALGEDFRKSGRDIYKLHAEKFIDHLQSEAWNK